MLGKVCIFVNLERTDKLYVMLQTQFHWWKLKTGSWACSCCLIHPSSASDVTLFFPRLHEQEVSLRCCHVLPSFIHYLHFSLLSSRSPPVRSSHLCIGSLCFLFSCIRPPFGTSDQTGSVLSAALTSIGCGEANLTVRQLKSMVLPALGLFLPAAATVFPEKSVAINDRSDLKISFLCSECSLHWKNVLRAVHYSCVREF